MVLNLLRLYDSLGFEAQKLPARLGKDDFLPSLLFSSCAQSNIRRKSEFQLEQRVLIVTFCNFSHWFQFVSDF